MIKFKKNTTKFSGIEEEILDLWAVGYFVRITGNVTDQIIKDYITSLLAYGVEYSKPISSFV